MSLHVTHTRMHACTQESTSVHSHHFGQHTQYTTVFNTVHTQYTTVFNTVHTQCTTVFNTVHTQYTAVFNTVHTQYTAVFNTVHTQYTATSRQLLQYNRKTYTDMVATYSGCVHSLQL